MTSLISVFIPFIVTSSLLGIVQAVCDIPTGQDTTYGEKFYIPYPETTVPSSSNISMTLYLLNPATEAIWVKIQEPGMTPEDVSVPATDAYTKTLGYYNMSSGTVVSQAVTILSSTKGFGVVVTMSHAMDGYTAMPLTSWGQRYMATTYWQEGGGPSQIVIVAQEAGQVTVKIPPQDSRTISVLDTVNPAGTEDLVQDLQAGDVWQIQRDYDLTGTSITSNEPIAVFCGNTGTGVGSGEKVGAFMEQIPRTRSWGTQYVAFSTPHGSTEKHDLIRVLALKHDTVIYAAGLERRITLKRGRYITRKLDDHATYIQANLPLMVVKFTYSDSEFPTMTIVMPTAQFLKSKNALFPKLPTAVSQHLVVLTRKKYESCYNSSSDLILHDTFELDSLDVIVMHFSYNAASSLALLSCSIPSAQFAVYLVMDNDDATFQSPLAHSVAHTNPDCTPTAQSPGDGIDNDCDGEIDEDVCSPYNGTSATDCGKIHAGDPDVWGYRFSFLLPDHCSTATQDVNTKLFVTKLIDEDATVDVSTPLGSFQETHIMSAATKALNIYLPLHLKAVGSGMFDNITLLVTSNVEISVTFIDSSEDPACISMISVRLLPEDVLGTEYFAVTHCYQNECQIQVTAVHEGETQVKVLLKLDSSKTNLLTFLGQDYDDKEEICLTLTKGGSFQLQVLSRDLTGTHILASKPIAVLSGGKLTTIVVGAFKDGMAEQMPPVTAWGVHFFFFQSPTYYVCDNSKTDYLKIVSSEDGTHVQAGSESQLLDHAGDMWILEDMETLINITSNKPVLVIQMSPDCFFGDLDASMSILTPISQYGFEDILPNVGDKVYFWMLAVQPDDGSNLEIQIGSSQYTMLEGAFNASFFNWTATEDVSVRGTPNLFPIGGQVYNFKRRQTGMHPIAFLAQEINQPCLITQGIRGDGIDNDCDGEVDEEPCTMNAPADTDDDGMVNEDCAPEPPPESSSVAASSWTIASSLSSEVITTLTESGSIEVSAVSKDPKTSTMSAINTVSTESGIEVSSTLQTSTHTLSPSTVSTEPQTLSLTPTLSLSSSIATSSGAASISTTPGGLVGSQTVVEGSLCSCDCPANVVTTRLEESELNQVLASIQNELYVDKTEVSKTKRMYISAQDHRPSAQAVGWLGVGMISATLIGILLFDLPVLIREVLNLIRSCKPNGE